MKILPATAEDRSAIWEILEPVIRAGETYTLDRDLSEDAALAYWLGSEQKRHSLPKMARKLSGPIICAPTRQAAVTMCVIVAKSREWEPQGAV